MSDGGELDDAPPTRRGAHLAPTAARVARLGDRALLLGDCASPGSERYGGVGRWIDEAEAQRLVDDGLVDVDPVEPIDWMGAPGWYDALERLGDPQRDLGALWRSIEGRLESGDRVAQVDGMFVAAGRAGTFFGAQPPEGRWLPLDRAPEGAWCGVAPGYNDQNWRPMAFLVRPGGIRSLSLWDIEELRWAVLSRGVVVQEPEVARWDGRKFTLAFPAPAQLRRLYALRSWVDDSAPPGLRLGDLVGHLGVRLLPQDEQRSRP